ncbi:unnamed protein product [Coffea canephora]|uniref:Phosphatidylinositol N-acetylglucosaminyltransferase subunit H conserved domain-containing protein n=1 Tax=Coffea canephora TaxID=49390 RepID=A0A068U0U4_COFCA|nr:unnamed protein product [Coffea canephora]
MGESSAAADAYENGRYKYIHDIHKGPPEAIDVHHIVLQRSSQKKLLIFCFLTLLLFASSPFFFFLQQLNLLTTLPWSLLLGGLFVRLLSQKLVKKESVIILPAFGVQLETQYGSGRTIRRFVPINKILKPVLNECVTPVTCYWSLALIIRGEEELMLVFKELYPPVKMLVPIWKAVCAAIDVEET